MWKERKFMSGSRKKRFNIKIMNKLNIKLKKEIDDSYEIIFTQKIWEELSNFLLKNNKNKILIVSDSNVYPLHYYNLFTSIDTEIEVFSFEIKSWEENKNIEAVLDISKKLIEENFNRWDILIALWWWVVWDIVGMTASLFKRWIEFIQIPTSLLSMFDSSVWWKTWVDFEWIKNIIWSFKQPKLVLINSEYLETLPEKEILSWFFEGLKHSLIKSEEYFENFKIKWDLFFNQEKFNLQEIIKENVSVKADIVMEDEKEMWVRKNLNLGHTFGHALESMTDFKITHWVCVWFWIIYINILSNKLWYLSDKNLDEINSFILNKLDKIDLSEFNLNFEEIYKKMLSDKKNDDSDIFFILLEKPWKLFIEKFWVERKQILEESFKEFIKNTK